MTTRITSLPATLPAAPEALIKACGHIPHGFMLRIESEIERDETDTPTGEEFLTACVFQHAPGWEPGDVFDEDDPEHGWKDAGHPCDRFRDRVVFSITADSEANFEKLRHPETVAQPCVTWAKDAPRLTPDEAAHLATSGQCRHCKHLAVFHQDYCTVKDCGCPICVLGPEDVEPRT